VEKRLHNYLGSRLVLRQEGLQAAFYLRNGDSRNGNFLIERLPQGAIDTNWKISTQFRISPNGNADYITRLEDKCSIRSRRRGAS